MVIAREGETTIKVMLASRFQEAIDEAAMRLGAIDADAYTAGWNRDPWVEATDTPDLLAARIAASSIASWKREASMTLIVVSPSRAITIDGISRQRMI